jgi:hypothetical protein
LRLPRVPFFLTPLSSPLRSSVTVAASSSSTIRTKGKQFSVDAAADAYRHPPRIPYILTPSAPASAYRASSPALSLPAYTLPRTGANFCPLPLRRPVLRFPPPLPSATAVARLHGPPLFSVQQVARSFKTCRRSFVRFKKPKHRQSSALRRQERYLRREELRGVVCQAAREGGGHTTWRRLFRQPHTDTDTVYARVPRHFYPR